MAVSVLMLTEQEIRELLGYRRAIDLVRRAFVQYSQGEVLLPAVMSFDFRESVGETHVKGAHLKGSPFFSVKVASGFYRNPDQGLPVGSGVVLVFDATCGQLRAILFDNGYLTDLRTAAAGAVAADYLALDDVQSVGLVGCGVQAAYQLAALLEVRRPRRVVVYCPTRRHAETYAAAAAETHGLEAVVADTPVQAVEGMDLVITATPSQAAIVQAEWLHPGSHITAIGADMPHKQELDAMVLRRADKVVVDSLAQASRQGDLHHALEAGVLSVSDVYAELGELVAGAKPGRERPEEITVADLTGVGVLDAAVAGFVTEEALRRGIGRSLTV